jgi:hypothetical protein
LKFEAVEHIPFYIFRKDILSCGTAREETVVGFFFKTTYGFYNCIKIECDLNNVRSKTVECDFQNWTHKGRKRQHNPKPF